MLNESIGLETKKKELLIFFVVAYGGSFLIGIPFNLHHQYLPYIQATVMMFLPATGVILAGRGKYRNMEHKIFCRLYIAGTVCLLLCTALYIAGMIRSSAAKGMVDAVIFAVSVISIILILMNRECRILKSLKQVRGVFLGFILIQIFIGLLGSRGDAVTYVKVVMLLIPTSVIGFCQGMSMYVGEEYGWRGFLQEVLQSKFGLIWGVVILGILWEVWHAPLWFTQYEMNIPSIVLRFFVTVCFSVFMGYIYLKTRNVWVCAIFHFLNNHLCNGFVGR